MSTTEASAPMEPGLEICRVKRPVLRTLACLLAVVLEGVLCLLLAGDAAAQEPQRRKGDPPANRRTFRLDYQATVADVPPGALVRVWVPVPQSNEHQDIELLARQLPATGRTAVEPKYGNKILSFDASPAEGGDMAFHLSMRVTRREIRLPRPSGGPPAVAQIPDDQRTLFLSANQKVPLEGRPLELLATVSLPEDKLARARVLFDRVDQHVRYDKSRPGFGNGDVLWVCDSRFGNCTDFHSLFMSLARSQGLPTRFEIGFALPRRRGEGSIDGYHCWAMFHVAEYGWLPVDISEADKDPAMRDYYFGNLTEDRVVFTVGRDIDLVPPQAAPPLNYFVYPHVEVDGKPLANDQLRLRFTYSDL